MVTKICWILPKYFNDDDFIKLIPAIKQKMNNSSAAVSVYIYCNDGMSIPIDDPNIHCVVSENIGYLASLQNAYYTSNTDYDFWILSNADIKIDNLDLDLFTSLDTYSVTSPSITSFNGSVSAEHMNNRPSYARMLFLKMIVNNLFLSQIYHLISFFKYKLKRWKGSQRLINDASSGKIYAPAGSFFITGGRALEEILKEIYEPKLFGEEQFIAEMCLRNSINVIKDNRIRIQHRGFATTNIFKSNATLIYKKEAVNFNFHKFYAQL